MTVKLILWFHRNEGLMKFIETVVAMETGLHIDVFSQPSYKMATIPGVTALTSESGQLRFNAGGRGFTIDAVHILRHEIAFYEVTD